MAVYSSAKEYDLKASEDSIGQLRPIILSKDGWVVDGLHRLEIDPGWRTERHEDIDTEEKKWVARAHANLARRTVGEEEKLEIINRLAKIYEEQGLGVMVATPMETPSGGEYVAYVNQILSKVIEVLSGAISPRVIRALIDPKYIQEKASQISKKIAEEKRKEISIIERLKADKIHAEERYGPGFVEKLEEEVREEVREELKQDTGFRDDIKKEVKEELRRDPEFISEVEREIIHPPIPRAKKEPQRREFPTEAVNMITVGLRPDIFSRLTKFMEKHKMMIDPAVNKLLSNALKAEGIE